MSSTEQREHTISQFIAQVTSVGGHVTRVPDLQAVRQYIVKLAADSKANRIVVCGRGSMSGLFRPDVVLEPFEIAREADMPRQKFFDAIRTADVGVTPVDLGIAETGTLVHVTSDESERLVTALPRIHVALLPCSRLVFSLLDAEPHLSRFLAGANAGTVVSLISGPSKTGDIGDMLIVGVHGPKELHVCLLDQDLSGDA